MSKLILHNYFRSSTSFRVRAALNLKCLDYQYVAYHLGKKQQRADAYLRLNPQGLVPALEISSKKVVTQSLAIIEYLDEVYPQVPLLPKAPLERARVRSIAMMVACDIHPLNNLRVLERLRAEHGADDDAVASWFRHWATETFIAIETRLVCESETGQYCHGDSPSLADICLVAQVVNNKRFDIGLDLYPAIARIYDRCMSNAAFVAAMPANQPDTE